MEQATAIHERPAMDEIQGCIARYAHSLRFEDLSNEVVHAAKVRIIDALGALMAGFFSPPACIARDIAAHMPNPHGATIIGTRLKTLPDMAAFVNGTTARYIELGDIYEGAGSFGGHPSDVVSPLLGVAEYVRCDGRQFIAGIVLAYELFCRVSDVFHNQGFDYTNIGCLAEVAAAAKLMKLDIDALGHAISMAMVSSNTLRQVRLPHLSMYKAVASGHGARVAIFAAFLARAGMQGPHQPFTGTAGWCDHVARARFTLAPMGGQDVPFRILETHIKTRPSAGSTISSILAAEKIQVRGNINQVRHVSVEVYKAAKGYAGTGEARWNPDSRETADHSIPYVVAATLMDSTVTTQTFNDSRLRNPELRALMQKIEVVENEEFTRAYERIPQEHRTRVTVTMQNGERLTAECGAEESLTAPKTDQQIEAKFRQLTEETLGAKRVTSILDRLWSLDRLDDVAEIPPAFCMI